MTYRRHSMPFGAELQEDGRVHFQLWAPAAEQIDVCLEHAIFPMTQEQDGWFSLVSDMAGIGALYKFRIDGEMRVPDPASRFQPRDVHGPSEVIDPGAWRWQDGDWRGRPWEEAIIYELHVGSFSQAGDFSAVQEKLDYLVGIGITAIELMPVADFPGRRSWGYDGAYLFAPDAQYGRPEQLKALIEAAHARGLMVFLDVVYNHFGPEGNYLHVYAPQFFTERHHTPWGAAINFDDQGCDRVRQFFIHNALYWLEEFHFDGLRLDAVHAVKDDSRPDILVELAETVRRCFGNKRQVHLILENDHNAARYLTRDETKRPQWYAAQWNDDFHHALHVLYTGEVDGYYVDYADEPIHYLGRCLTEGFAYQGEPSPHRNNKPRGEPSGHLPPDAFVSFLVNHDQAGNRAFGERLNTLTCADQFHSAIALLLLAPFTPLLFMGHEWCCTRPFWFFCDLEEDLKRQVVQGRRDEFARFPAFSDPASREKIPDPTAESTFQATILDWGEQKTRESQYWLELHRKLCRLRHQQLVPRLRRLRMGESHYQQLSRHALHVRWPLDDGTELALMANMGRSPLAGVQLPRNKLLYATHAESSQNDRLPAWSVFWYLGAGT